MGGVFATPSSSRGCNAAASTPKDNDTSKANVDNILASGLGFETYLVKGSGDLYFALQVFCGVKPVVHGCGHFRQPENCPIGNYRDGTGCRSSDKSFYP
jgi:hypothetical protein